MKTLAKKLKNKKGFTLMEMLIVVAIMVILVSVSIPIFTSQLNEAKKATDEANVRAAKAAALSLYLMGGKVGSSDVAVGTDDSYKYDADKGVLVADDTTLSKGYGQSTTADADAITTTVVPNGKVIKVTITGGTVTYDWVTP